MGGQPRRSVSRFAATSEEGVGVSVPANLITTSRAAPVPVAVDLGSGSVRVWAAHRGTLSGPSGDVSACTGSLVRRGRIVDAEGCRVLLSELLRRYPEPVPAGGVVVACRPVLAAPVDQQEMRRLLTAVFAPSRVLFIDTVRAAAIGVGAAAGTLVIADIGAHLSEVAVLEEGHVVAARRADIGTGDIGTQTGIDLLTGTVARQVADVRDDPAVLGVDRALTRRGLVLVGDGAAQPQLAMRLSAALRTRVHCAAAPRSAALNGAGLAAMAALRHPALA
jgi:rod shape-determining protein MreB